MAIQKDPELTRITDMYIILRGRASEPRSGVARCTCSHSTRCFQDDPKTLLEALLQDVDGSRCPPRSCVRFSFKRASRSLPTTGFFRSRSLDVFHYFRAAKGSQVGAMLELVLGGVLERSWDGFGGVFGCFGGVLGRLGASWRLQNPWEPLPVADAQGPLLRIPSGRIRILGKGNIRK